MDPRDMHSPDQPEWPSIRDFAQHMDANEIRRMLEEVARRAGAPPVVGLGREERPARFRMLPQASPGFTPRREGVHPTLQILSVWMLLIVFLVVMVAFGT